MEKVICIHCGKENKLTARYCSDCGYELPKVENDLIEQPLQQSHSIKTDKRKRLISLIFGAIGFGLSWFAVQQIFFTSPSIDKVLMNTASEINKTCPVMVDQETRLDNTIALPNNTIQYNYTLVNIDKSELNLDTIKKYFEPALINKTKSDPGLNFFRKNNVIMDYNYRDKNGVFIVKYSITPEIYNNN